MPFLRRALGAAILVPLAAAAPPPPPPVVGSGFFVDSSGTLLTAAHTVEGCRAINAEAPDMPRRAAALARLDHGHDLALLRVNARSAPLAFGAPAAGGPATLAGYPAAATTPVRTRAAILNARALGDANPEHILWLDAPGAGGGWSGAPVLNGAGEAIGMALALSPRREETARLLRAPPAETVIATGTTPLRGMLARAGVPPVARGGGTEALAKVYCWR